MDTKALRQKILDLAICGKLVPQDPNDEPASVLLERIREQKMQMVKEGKLKAKDIKNDTIIFVGEDNLHYEKFQDGTVKCIEDEIPFEVPEGWEWTRLVSICLKVTDGTHHSPDNFPTGEYKYITAKNIKSNGIVLDDITYVTAEVHKEIFARCNPEFGDILYIKDGATSGIATVNTLHEEFSMLSSVALLKPSIGIDNWYMCYAMQSPYFYNTTRGDMKGVGITRITLNMLTSRLIPIPPQNEQRQISANTSKLIELIVSIEKSKDDVLELIATTKSKILDLAIRGKLVPQDPNDEPASILLERIRAEKEELIKQGKIKRDKKKSVIFKGDDNSYYEKIGNTIENLDSIIPFEIPDNWEFIRFKEIWNLISGRDLLPSEYNNQKVGIPYITGASNFNDGTIELIRWTPNPQVITHYGDLLITCKGTIGEMGFNNFGDAHIARQIMAIRNTFNLNSEFLSYCICFYINSIKASAKGIIPGISREDILNLILPIPPSEYQEQVVAYIRKVNVLFDSLEKSLN